MIHQEDFKDLSLTDMITIRDAIRRYDDARAKYNIAMLKLNQLELAYMNNPYWVAEMLTKMIDEEQNKENESHANK